MFPAMVPRLIIDPAKEPAALIADLDRAMAAGTSLECRLVPDYARPISQTNPSFTGRFMVDRLPDGTYRLMPVGPITRRVSE
jgi:hypothetical protein